MSADILGARLLADVQEEGLDDLLSEVRQLANPQPRGVFGLPPLDRLVEAFRSPAPVPTAQHERWRSPAPEDSDTSSGINVPTPARRSTGSIPRFKPAVIEVTSPSSASGKTNLLYYLAALALLPKRYNGNETAIVWLDTDARFSPLRLNTVLLSHLSKPDDKYLLSLSEKEALARLALHHVHVFRPQSSAQLLVTLQSLSPYLLSNQTGESQSQPHASGPRALGAIILDSATAFYWQDRSDAEMAHIEAIGSTITTEGAVSGIARSKAAETIALLKRLQREFDCSVLFTTSPHSEASAASSRHAPGDRSINVAVAGGAGSVSGPESGPYQPPRPQQSRLVKPWSAYAVVTLVIERAKVPRFAGQMALEECERDQEARFKAVSQGRFVVGVDWEGMVGWGGVRERVGRLEGGGVIGMTITQEGVVVD